MRPEAEPAPTVAFHEPMNLECNRQPVRRRPRQPAAFDELSERGWLVSQAIENHNRFVEDADAVVAAARELSEAAGFTG